MPVIVTNRRLQPPAEEKLRRTVSLAEAEPAPSRSARSIHRATAIIGLLLEGLGDAHEAKGRRFQATVTGAVRGAWTVVELATPQDARALLYQYWIAAILALGLIMVLIGALTSREQVVPLGLMVIALGALLHLGSEWFRKFLLKPWWVVGAASLALVGTSWLGWQLLQRLAAAAPVLVLSAGNVTANRLLEQLAEVLSTRSVSAPQPEVALNLSELESLLLTDTAFAALYVLWIVAASALLGLLCRGFLPRAHVALVGVVVLAVGAGVADGVENLLVWRALTGPPTAPASSGFSLVVMIKLAGILASVILLLNLLRVVVWFRFTGWVSWLVRLSLRKERIQPESHDRRAALTDRLLQASRRLRKKRRRVEPHSQNAGSSLLERTPRRLSDGATQILSRTVKLAAEAPAEVGTARSVTRAIGVSGELLEGLTAARCRPAAPFAVWIARAGSVGRALVECSVPRSLGEILFAHWIRVGLLLVAAMFAVGLIRAVPNVSNLAGTLFLIITAALVVTGLLRSWFRRARWVYGVGLPATFLGAYLIGVALVAVDPVQLRTSWTPGFSATSTWTAASLAIDFVFIGGYAAICMGLALLVSAESPLRASLPRLTTGLLWLLGVLIAITVLADITENLQLWLGIRLLPVAPTAIKLGFAAAALILLMTLCAAAGVLAAVGRLTLMRQPKVL